MTANVIWSWLHFISIFTLFAALAIEHLLFKPVLDATTARKIGAADAVYGISAGLVLLTGIARMIHEKGLGFYMQHWAFHVLVTLFVLVGLISIYPTLVFLRWRKQTKIGQAPLLDASTAQRVIMIIRLELLLMLIIPLFAALMARGS